MVRRLTTRVTRWTVRDDAALVRLMAYLKTEASLELVGTLWPDDVTGLQLERTSRTVSGMHLELVNPKSGNVFPLAWRSSGQSATSCSRERGGRPQSRIETFWTSRTGLGA